MLRVRHFRHISGAGTIFTAKAEALNDAGKRQNNRRPDTNGLIGWRYRNHQRAKTHHQHGNSQRGAPPIAIRQLTKQPAAERAHQERDGKKGGGFQVFHHRITRWEKAGGKENLEGGIGVEIIPFHQIAD